MHCSWAEATEEEEGVMMQQVQDVGTGTQQQTAGRCWKAHYQTTCREGLVAESSLVLLLRTRPALMHLLDV